METRFPQGFDLATYTQAVSQLSYLMTEVMHNEMGVDRFVEKFDAAISVLKRAGLTLDVRGKAEGGRFDLIIKGAICELQRLYGDTKGWV